MPLARTRQGAATRRAQTVAPGNTPQRVGRREQQRALIAGRGNTWPVKAETRSQIACCAERASSRHRLGRRIQQRASIAERVNIFQVKAGMERQIVCCAERASSRHRLGRRIASFVQKGNSQP